MLPPDTGPLLIALSGGGDSIALALLLVEIQKYHGRELYAYHLDHGLRFEESKADALFVKKWCKEKKLKLKIEKAPELTEYMKKNRLSLEEAAREYRYESMIKFAVEIKASAIVTGHTLDDDVETFLLRIGTGGSLKSLSGIPEISKRENVMLLRPLLTFKRDELRDFLISRKETWRDDSSNFSPVTLRNRVRLEAIPFLNTVFRRDIRDSIGRTLENLKRENDFVESILNERGLMTSCWIKLSTAWKTGFEGSVETLLSFHPSLRNRIILWALDELGLPIKRRKSDIFIMADNFLHLSGGKRNHNIGKRIYLARSGKAFIIAKVKRSAEDFAFDPKALDAASYIMEVIRMEKKETKRITKPGKYKIGEIEITVEAVDRTEMELSKSKSLDEIVEYFDPSILEGGLELVSGASITNHESSQGSEKIQKDYKTLGNKTLVDHWVGWPVLKKNDELIWIVGVSRRKVYNPEESEKAIRIKASLPSNLKIYL